MGRFRSGAVKSAAGLAFVLACAVSGLSQSKVFRVDVQLVRLLATVKDMNGQLIGDLQKNDFQVYDNGVLQQLRVFEHHSEQPLSVSLMVDISGSTAKELKYELDSVSRFLGAIFREGSPEDAVSLYSFNWEVRQQTRYSRDLSMMKSRMKAFHPEAGTAMYDAIHFGARDLEQREGRHVIVMVTDGGDTTSTTSYQQALRSIQMADAVFYAILVVPITNDVGRNIGGENALTTLSASTGGKVFSPTVGAALDEAFDQILRELRTQYLLAYYPKDVPLTKDPFHRIEIKTARKDLRVISRNGYYGDSIH